MDLIDKYLLREGKLSWAKTDVFAKKYGGKYKKTDERGKPWNTYVFSNEDNYRNFVKEMKTGFMNFKADPKKLEVKVWF